MLIIGIDPGLDGGLAVLNGCEVFSVLPMPTVQIVKASGKGVKRELDTAELRRWLCQGVGHCFLEAPQVRPLFRKGRAGDDEKPAGTSIHQGLTIGRNFGVIEGLLVGLKVPYTLVWPHVWTKVIRAGTPDGAGKGRTLLAVQRLFPGVVLRGTDRSRKPHDGIVDALGIAEYGRRVLRGKRDDAQI